MNESNIINKVEELRRIYKDPVDQGTINELEKKLRESAEKAELYQNPVVGEFIADALKRVSDVSYLLVWDAKLDEETRKRLFVERDVHLFWLKRFNGSMARKAIQSIEEAINAKLVA